MSRRLKILGGALRGQRLEVVGSVRPTESRVREALASIWGPRLAGCRFLDLFAGSGAVGFEAASRGAAAVWFLDREPRVLAALGRGSARLAPGRTRVLRRRLPPAPGSDLGERFDLVFADPPYRFDDYAALLAGAESWLAADGEMAIEHASRRHIAAAAPWIEVDRRTYGDCCLTFFRLR